MYHVDHPHDSADFDGKAEPRANPRADDEVVVERTSIIADAARDESDHSPSSIASERRRSERRRIDRMGTGI